MHATQRALLKAIAASPHDDTPRLVYADWLDEYAAELPAKVRASTAARAEIIRVQCELARLAEEDSDSRWVYEYLDAQGMYDLKLAGYCVDWSTVDAKLARRVTLQARQLELLATFSGEWQKTEVPEIEGASFYLQRGFWTRISFSRGRQGIRPLLTALKKHDGLIPPEILFVEGEPTKAEVEELVRAKLTDHLVSVGGSGGRTVLLTVLSQKKSTQSIREVGLGSGPQNYTAHLARSANWNGIEAIRVVAHGNHGIPGLDRLSDCPHLSGLRILELNDDSQANYWDVLFVAEGVWKNLRKLNWDAWLEDRSVGAVCEGSATGELRYLRLSNKVGGNGATAVLTAEHLKQLVVVDLHGNMIRNLKRSAFTKAQRPNLRVLNLGGANGARWRGSKDFTEADLVTVVASSITHQLQILDLSGNGFADAAMKAFFRAMQMPQLAMLSLSHNQKLGPVTASAIAACGQLRNLQSLDLMWTKIGDTGAKALAKSKHLNRLRHLDVTQAGVTASGLAALRKRFGEDVVRA